MMAAPTSATNEPADANSHAISSQQLHSIENAQISADTSVNESDSEAAKNDGKIQARASVKKPTFKAVSVNKTFLAAKSAANSQLKASEKSVSSSAASTPPTTSTLPASRPRLIAKTGGNGPVPKFAGVSGGPSPAAPESAGVWNKNRPTAPATPPVDPKKLTDEDLKKDGIHVASRLHSDNTRGGQSNWADIEDDDDGWVPEAITWNDGTKTAIPHTDSAHASPVVLNSTPSKSTTMTTPTPATATLKPPSTASGSFGTGRSGLVLRASSNEKPALVSKAPGLTGPTKSPWAPLPSIEKVSPAAALMPTPHQSQQQFHQQHNHQIHQNGGYGNHHNHRDSYNSRNIDPAMDRRNDYGRQGSIAGRPRQGSFNDQSHASGYPPRQMSNDGPWDRNRRGSMNMGSGPGRYHQMSGPPPPYSGYPNDYHSGPGNYGSRRPSFTDGPRRPSFSEGPRRPSINEGSVTIGPLGYNKFHDNISGPSPIPNLPSVNGSDISHTGFRSHGPGLWQNRNSVSPSVSQAAVSLPSPAIAEEETAEFQKKLMREKAEEAMRRRQEQEAKEEAAKQERLRRKLEALGPAPERTSTKKSTPVVASSSPKKTESQDTAQISVPENLQVRTKEQLATAHPDFDTNEQQILQQESRNATKHQSVWDSSVSPAQSQQAGPPPPRILGSSGWGSSSQQRNVWGAPNNDRGLGNGAFIGGAASVSHPAPIAPPSRKVSGAETPDTADHQARQSTPNKHEAQSHDLPPSLLKTTWRNQETDGTNDVEGNAPTVQIQSRPSRFFPTRDVRTETSMRLGGYENIRVRTPSPPPPIAEDHPVYDGNPFQPNVLLPRPHPVVRLPPVSGHVLGADSNRALSSSSSINAPGHWKSKISSLLSDHKPKSPVLRRNSIEESRSIRPVSRGTLAGRSGVASSLPTILEPTSMPMSTDCFEEPEMGSLPLIRIPKVAPVAAWRPVMLQTKPLPRRFIILNNMTSKEPDFFDPAGQIRIRLSTMTTARYITHASAQAPRVPSYEGRPRRGRSNRAQRQESNHAIPTVSRILQNKPVHQDAADATLSTLESLQIESRGGGNKDSRERREGRRRWGSLNSRDAREPLREFRESGPSSVGNDNSHGSSNGRRGRGGYRGRGSEWGRRGGAVPSH